MFETQTPKTELIIVCDDKTSEYANHLMQLIGTVDDGEKTTIGTKDGSVSAAVWTVKEYKDTLSKITSDTHVLFMGKNKDAKKEAKFIDYKIDCFGMKYGWKGKRAVMFVEKELKKDSYSAFVKYAHNYGLKHEEIPKWRFWEVIGIAACFLIFPPIAIILAIIKNNQKKEKMKEQQYHCLTSVMYLDGLQAFLEE